MSIITVITLFYTMVESVVIISYILLWSPAATWRRRWLWDTWRRVLISDLLLYKRAVLMQRTPREAKAVYPRVWKRKTIKSI